MELHTKPKTPLILCKNSSLISGVLVRDCSGFQHHGQQLINKTAAYRQSLDAAISHMMSKLSGRNID